MLGGGRIQVPRGVIPPTPKAALPIATSTSGPPMSRVDAADTLRDHDEALTGTLLLVDDDDALVAALSRSITTRFPAIRIVTANDGPLALQIIERLDPDVVVSDHVMPGMSGLALLSAVKARRPAAARVLLTGFAESQAYWHAIRAHTVDTVMQKPGTTAQLAAAIRQGLALCAKRRANPPPVLEAHGEVLIVGGGAQIGEAIEQHFGATTEDVRVRTAPSASAALDAIGRRPADVILADANLPDMPGADFLARVHLALPRARTILVAAAPEVREAPGVDHLFKLPVDLERVARAVERLLPHERAHARGAPPGE